MSKRRNSKSGSKSKRKIVSNSRQVTYEIPLPEGFNGKICTVTFYYTQESLELENPDGVICHFSAVISDICSKENMVLDCYDCEINPNEDFATQICKATIEGFNLSLKYGAYQVHAPGPQLLDKVVDGDETIYTFYHLSMEKFLEIYLSDDSSFLPYAPGNFEERFKPFPQNPINE